MELALNTSFLAKKYPDSLPEFTLLGMNARAVSAIPVVGRYRYYFGWAEYDAYIQDALKGMLKLKINKDLIDEEFVAQVKQINERWNKNHDQNLIEKIKTIFPNQDRDLMKFEQRQQVYQTIIRQKPQIIFINNNEDDLVATLRVLHRLTLRNTLLLEPQKKQIELQGYFKHLQNWHATCSDEALCLFYLQAMSETLDLLVFEYQANAVQDVGKFDDLSPLKPIIERLSLNEAAQLRIVLHLIGSNEIYQKADEFSKENPEVLNQTQSRIVRYLIQPLMRLFVLHNDSANLYWLKQKQMMTLANLDLIQLKQLKPEQLSIPRRYLTPKNFLGKMAAWMNNDLETQIAAYHKVQQKLLLIRYWKNNEYQLNLDHWKNKDPFIYQNNTNEICLKNPLFDHFIRYKVQIRDQCIGAQGIVNRDINVFQSENEMLHAVDTEILQ